MIFCGKPQNNILKFATNCAYISALGVKGEKFDVIEQRLWSSNIFGVGVGVTDRDRDSDSDGDGDGDGDDDSDGDGDDDSDGDGDGDGDGEDNHLQIPQLQGCCGINSLKIIVVKTSGC